MRTLSLRCSALALSLFLAAIASQNLRADPWLSAGYQETVFSVSSLSGYETFLKTVAGWEVVAAGKLDPATLHAWGLPQQATARFSVMANPATQRGYIRLIQFDDVDQQHIRSNAQSWDTGGWFDVNTRIVDMAKKFAQLQSAGWQATSDPVRFKFAQFEVIEWLARGPDGIVIAMIERVAPVLTGWPQLREMSRLFNATQIVKDLDEARSFYEGILGFQPYLEHSGASPEDGPNVLGIPHNLADEVVRDIAILSPDGRNEGSIELLTFEGLDGADFSHLAVPPNLGILMLRFPTDDIAALHQHLRANEVEIAFQPIRVNLPPYGDTLLMAARGPGGVWLEFFQTAAKSVE
ncbi:MAG: VOC family protein [Pseudomonadota bacterium]